VTRSGRALAGKAPRAVQDRLIETLAGLPPADLRQLARILTDIGAGLEPSGKPPAMFFEGQARTTP
jgi:hypothetical protein